MNISTSVQEISIANQLLKQLEDEYLSVHSQNISMPKQNVEPQNDPQNPYQPLDFDDDDEQQQYNEQNQQQQSNSQLNEQNQKEELSEQQDLNQFKKQIQGIRLSQAESNPEMNELIEVPPVDESIYTSLPRKQFQIDEDKIKSFALSMDIPQPDWLKNQSLCKLRIQELFMKQAKGKPFTKI